MSYSFQPVPSGGFGIYKNDGNKSDKIASTPHQETASEIAKALNSREKYLEKIKQSKNAKA